MEEVTVNELRDYLYKYLLEERKLSSKAVNHYNNVIRFVYEVTLDKIINKKQLPQAYLINAFHKYMGRL